MFKIIGTDGKEYGPISVDQVRRWVSEGRANGQTSVQAVGQTDWKPLSSFPELNSLPQFTEPPVLAPVEGHKSKLAAGLLGIFLGGIGVHRFYLGYVKGILIIAGTTITTDARGRPLKD